MMQRRFGIGLDRGEACVGRGVMTEIRRGPWWTVPFLQIGRLRNILVPDVGTDVPFTIENYPYRDPFGRETVTFVREYTVGRRRRRFDATMILVGDRIVDYLGTHQHLAVDLDLKVDERRRAAPHLGCATVLRGCPSASGSRCVQRASDAARTLATTPTSGSTSTSRCATTVFGFLFGYRGSFTCEWVPATDAPGRLKPVRHEART